MTFFKLLLKLPSGVLTLFGMISVVFIFVNHAMPTLFEWYCIDSYGAPFPRDKESIIHFIYLAFGIWLMGTIHGKSESLGNITIGLSFAGYCGVLMYISLTSTTAQMADGQALLGKNMFGSLIFTVLLILVYLVGFAMFKPHRR